MRMTQQPDSLDSDGCSLSSAQIPVSLAGTVCGNRGLPSLQAGDGDGLVANLGRDESNDTTTASASDSWLLSVQEHADSPTRPSRSRGAPCRGRISRFDGHFNANVRHQNSRRA